jgi:hypothetical protein
MRTDHPECARSATARRLARALDAPDGAPPRGSPLTCGPDALAQLLGLQALFSLLGGTRRTERTEEDPP